MSGKFIKKFIQKKEKAQTLLVVIVISTLSLMLILGMADRIALTRVNLRRSAEFDRSIAIAENRINDIIKAIDAQAVRGCIDQKISPQTTSYVSLDCSDITDPTFLSSRVYGRVSSDAAVEVTRDIPLTLVLSDDPVAGGKATTGIVARCSLGPNGQPTQARFMFTRIFREFTGDIRTDKAIIQCDQGGMTQPVVLTLQGNVPLLSTTEPGSVGTPVSTFGKKRDATLAVRIKAIDDSNTANTTLIELKVIGDTDNDGQPDVIASTGKYEFLVAGFGEFGSDSLITFTRPLDSANNYSPSLFDYVYLGEDY